MSASGTVAEQRAAEPGQGLMVEDPEVAAAIAELKARWPAIGEAADHPLTEFFYLGAGREEASFGKRGRRGAIFFGLTKKEILPWLWMPLYVAAFHWNYFFWLLAIIVIYQAWSQRQRRRGKDQERLGGIELSSEPYSLLKGDDSQRAEWWLAPLSYREFLGICVGFHYARARTGSTWRNRLQWRALVRHIPTVLFSIYLFRYMVGATAFQVALAFAGYFIVMATIPRNASFHLRAALDEAANTVKRVRGNERDASNGLKGCAVLLCLMVLTVMLFWMRGHGVSWAITLMAVLACVCILQLAGVLARGTDHCAAFEQDIAEGAVKFESRRAPWRVE